MISLDSPAQLSLSPPRYTPDRTNSKARDREAKSREREARAPEREARGYEKEERSRVKEGRERERKMMSYTDKMEQEHTYTAINGDRHLKRL